MKSIKEKETHMKSNETEKQNVGKIFLEELGRSFTPTGKKKSFWSSFLIPFLAILTGLIFGALFNVITNVDVYTAFQSSFLNGLSVAWKSIAVSYTALFYGAIGEPKVILEALRSRDTAMLIKAFSPILESLVATTPYIFGGLAVALGFKSGVFNIGAEGQILIGASASVFIGYALTGLPAIIHIPLALLAGFIGGGIWGYIPGWLKAKTGGHEVINTIMMNYIAFYLNDWLLRGPMRRADTMQPVSPLIQPSAELPKLFPYPIRFHIGFFIAIVFIFIVYFFLYKTTWGLNLRMVGANPRAAKYAGINISQYTILAMALSGAIAGLAGANEVLGVNHSLYVAFSSGYGFNSIALALIGNNNPFGVGLAALLFGTLENGATRMQMDAAIPVEIISIIQATILMFIAAPAIVRTIFRLRDPKKIELETTSAKLGGM
jgi:simple sugar transport system permease protein